MQRRADASCGKSSIRRHSPVYQTGGQADRLTIWLGLGSGAAPRKVRDSLAYQQRPPEGFLSCDPNSKMKRSGGTLGRARWSPQKRRSFGSGWGRQVLAKVRHTTSVEWKMTMRCRTVEEGLQTWRPAAQHRQRRTVAARPFRLRGKLSPLRN